MDIGAMFQTWIDAITQPNAEYYENERHSPNATLGTAIIWMVISAVISAVLGAVALAVGLGALDMSGALEEILTNPDIPPEARMVLEGFLSSGGLASLAGAGLIMGVIFTPIGFLIGAGILHVIARLFGGQGNFGRFSYLLAAFQAPISVISGLLGLIPGVGGCISGLLGIYSLVLTYFAIKTEHQLSQGRAIMAVLVPIIVVFALVMCAVIGFIVVALPQLEGLQ